MRRHLLTVALTGLFGALLLSSDASACCFKKKKCAQPCAPAPCVAVAPCPAPAPCPEPVVCKPRKKLFAGLCHKKQVCAPMVVYATPTCAPMVYASGQYASGQH